MFVHLARTSATIFLTSGTFCRSQKRPRDVFELQKDPLAQKKWPRFWPRYEITISPGIHRTQPNLIGPTLQRWQRNSSIQL